MVNVRLQAQLPVVAALITPYRSLLQIHFEPFKVNANALLGLAYVILKVWDTSIQTFSVWRDLSETLRV